MEITRWGKTNRLERYIACTGIAFLIFVGSTPAATVSIPPAQDTTIYQGVDPGSGEDFEDNSCGAGVNLFAGVTVDGFSRRTLLRFDIAGNIPQGSLITSVALSITVNRSGDNQIADMTLHRASQDWGEGLVDCDAGAGGGGQGLDAQTGDATWLEAQHDLVLWTSPGGDFAAPSAVTGVPSNNGGIGTWDSAANPALVTDVQSFLDDPAGNFGWILVGDETRVSTTRRFNSREGGNSPQLVVEFEGTGFACCFANGSCSILDTVDCTAQGGTPDTNFDSCLPNPCPQPSGACCNQDESCSDGVAKDVCEAAGGIFQGPDSLCSDNQVDCGLQPFIDALPLPGVAQPIGTRADGVLQYEIDMTQQKQQLHSELPETDVWTYNGTYPGPTIEAWVGQPIEIKYINSLPSGGRRGGHYLEVDECAHGPNYWRDTQRTVVHLHGGHVPARFDGQPEYDFLPGEFDVYEYPNNQDPATLWYHDHALGITRLNVYMGLAGYYLLRDQFEIDLGLPAGEFEIPAVIQDREFNPDGTLFYPPTLQDAFFGDKVLVNGKVWPFLNVKQGKYRIRLLNGSQARSYRLRLENLADPAQIIPFTLIGTDGGLITAPIDLDEIYMASAERFDVVVDFASFPAGTEIVLRNDDLSTPRLSNVMKFIVLGGRSDSGE
ncbi:MAG: multicopper oxidase domain-containing protein [Planctomycetota bacterium]|jgi:hypothetical protein